MADPVERIKAAISDGRLVNDAVAMDAANEILQLRRLLHAATEGPWQPYMLDEARELLKGKVRARH